MGNKQTQKTARRRAGKQARKVERAAVMRHLWVKICSKFDDSYQCTNSEAHVLNRVE